MADAVFVGGIDVSHHNGVIDWAKVAADGVAYAYAKATEGVNTKDSQFNVNYLGMKQNQILRGAYHFFHPELDASSQATNFLSLVSRLTPDDLTPAIDVEVDDGQSASAITVAVQAWLDKVEQQLGRTPLIYTSASFWNTRLGATDAFARYPLWVAHYTNRAAPNIPQGFSDYTFWQYSESGTVSGISGNVDMDRFQGTIDDLNHMAGN
jgi:lysozyme